MYAYSDILAALIQRGRTGRGKRIDVSMLESMVEWMSYPLYYAFDGADAAAAQRRGARDDLSLRPVPGRRRRRRHARPAERARMAGLLRSACSSSPSSPTDPRFASNARAHRRARRAARDHRRDLRAADRRAGDRAARRGADRQRAREHMADVWAHPQLQARGRWTEVGDAGGAGAGAAAAGRAATRGDARMDAVPALGAHTDALLAELGSTPRRSRALRAARRRLSGAHRDGEHAMTPTIPASSSPPSPPTLRVRRRSRPPCSSAPKT